MRKYITEDMQFPCYILRMVEDKPIEKYKIAVLQKMFQTVETYDEEEAALIISIYISDDKRTLRLGQITPKQVKPFLRLFEKDLEQVIGYFDKNTELKDDLLYVLSE